MKLQNSGRLDCFDFSEVGVADGMVAWYPLKNDVNDYVSAYDGVNNGSIATARGYEFDGTNDHIKISEIEAFNLQTLTMSAWVKFADDSNSFIFEKGNVNTQYSMFATTTFHFRTVPNDGSSYDTLSGSKTSIGIINGTWHFITCTFDGTTKRVYVDGVEKLTKTWQKEIAVNNNDCSIGRFGGTSTGYYFTGSISDVRIYNRALSPEEVQVLYEITNPELNIRMKQTRERLYIKGQFEE